MIKINMLKRLIIIDFPFAVGHIFYQFQNKAFIVVQRTVLFQRLEWSVALKMCVPFVIVKFDKNSFKIILNGCLKIYYFQLKLPCPTFVHVIEYL